MIMTAWAVSLLWLAIPADADAASPKITPVPSPVLAQDASSEKSDAYRKLIENLEKKHPDPDRSAEFAKGRFAEYLKKVWFLDKDPDATPETVHHDFRLAAEYALLYFERSGREARIALMQAGYLFRSLDDLAGEDGLREARIVYEKLLEGYLGKKTLGSGPNRTLLIDYGEILNRLEDFAAAKAVWKKLIPLNPEGVDRKTSTWNDRAPHAVRILRGAAFCLGGWLEPDQETFREVSGTGDFALPREKATGLDPRLIYLTSAHDLWDRILRMERDAGRKYTPQWWEARCYTLYALYRQGEKEPEYSIWAGKIIGGQKRFTPDLGGVEWKSRIEYMEKAIAKRVSRDR